MKTLVFLFLILPFSLHAESYQVTRVVDGDTLVLEKIGKIRLIGADTPETKHPKKGLECYGPEATRYTVKMAQGKSVEIGFDGKAKKDRFKRELVYLYLPSGEMLNELLIKEGYAISHPKYSHEKKATFDQLEREAREAKRGKWGECL